MTQRIPPLAPPALAAVEAVRTYGSPVYLYDERAIVERCRGVSAIPHAFGVHVSYALKANSSRAILQVIAREGLGADASSFNEVRRALAAGIAPARIALTSQEVPEGADRSELEALLGEGLLYNACSLLQLEGIAGYVAKHEIPIGLRVNPGVGTGESVTRNTGDKYSSFGIHRANLEKAVGLAKARGVVIGHVHSHVGSGGDPALWRSNIDRMLNITEKLFPDAVSVNLGGGFREARMPDETAADIQELGAYAQTRFREFAERTGRKLAMRVEPGTYIVANSGYLVTTVIDKKWSGPDGFEFIILDAGMECNTRPLLYGARHPFYVVTSDGTLLSSEFDPDTAKYEARVICGKCCESGDSQTLDGQGNISPRRMADPAVGDLVLIGGVGAYCSSMSLTNYNSYLKAAEVMLRDGGSLQLIRKRQTLEQAMESEIALEA